MVLGFSQCYIPAQAANKRMLFAPAGLGPPFRCASLRPQMRALSVRMNYDEYIKEVEKFSGDEVIARLSRHLSEWKQDNTNAIELADLVERFFGNSWIQTEETHNHLYRLWSTFKKGAIDNIGGITMNERLYMFGLFQRFESSQSEAAQKVIYAKLCANT